MSENRTPDIEAYDDLEMWRCRQLGGPVTFKYCRVMNEGLPCVRLAECWWGQLDLAGFLAANYTEDDLRKAFGAPSKGRLARIIETLDRVKKEGRD